MFEKPDMNDKRSRKSPNTIIKISGSGRFVDITQSFAIGKILFGFRLYDESLPAGQRVTKKVDCYLSIDEAAYLAEICSNGTFGEIGKIKEKVRRDSGSKYADAIFENFSGKVDKSEVISKHMTLTMKNPGDSLYKKLPFTLTGEERPGKKTATGAIQPDYSSNKASYVQIGLTAEQVYKLGIQIKRSIAIYDTWVAMGTLQQNLDNLATWTRQLSNSNAYPQRGYSDYKRNTDYNAQNSRRDSQLQQARGDQNNYSNNRQVSGSDSRRQQSSNGAEIGRVEENFYSAAPAPGSIENGRIDRRFPAPQYSNTGGVESGRIVNYQV